MKYVVIVFLVFNNITELHVQVVQKVLDIGDFFVDAHDGFQGFGF